MNNNLLADMCQYFTLSVRVQLLSSKNKPTIEKVDTFLRKSVDSEDSQTPLKPQNENENLILAARTKSTENMKVNMTCQTSQIYIISGS